MKEIRFTEKDSKIELGKNRIIIISQSSGTDYWFSVHVNEKCFSLLSKDGVKDLIKEIYHLGQIHKENDKYDWVTTY